jgi:hypothetical protein
VYDTDTASPPAQLSPLQQQQQQQQQQQSKAALSSSVSAPKSSTTAAATALTAQGRKSHTRRPPATSAIVTASSAAVVPAAAVQDSALPHVMSFMFATGIGAVDRAARNEVELAAEIRALEQVSCFTQPHEVASVLSCI